MDFETLRTFLISDIKIIKTILHSQSSPLYMVKRPFKVHSQLRRVSFRVDQIAFVTFLVSLNQVATEYTKS